MRWLLLGYMYLFIHRPFEIWPALGEYRIEWYYMLLTGTVWLIYPGKKWLANPLQFAFAALAGAVFLSWLASPWSALISGPVETYFKQLVFYVVLITVVSDEKGLKQVMLGFLIVMSLYILHSFVEYLNGRHIYRMGIPRMVGVDRTLNDPNSFSASILYAIPIAAVFWRSQPGRGLRAFLIGYVLLSIVCILLTGSRTAFIGLVFVTLASTVSRRNWWRVAMPVLLLCPVIWLSLPEHLQNRFVTIVNPDAGPLSAKESADGRIMGLIHGLELWQRFPLTGAGPDAFILGSGQSLQAHNLYGQTAGELGTLGVLALAAVLAAFAWNARQARRLRAVPGMVPGFLHQVVNGVSLSVLLLLLLGCGGHNLYRFTWLWYGAFEIIAIACLRAEAAQLTAIWRFRASRSNLLRHPSRASGSLLRGWALPRMNPS